MCIYIKKNLDYFQGDEWGERLTVLGTKKRVAKWKSRFLGLRSKTCQSGSRLTLTAVTVLFKMSVSGFKQFPVRCCVERRLTPSQSFSGSHLAHASLVFVVVLGDKSRGINASYLAEVLNKDSSCRSRTQGLEKLTSLDS